jgi:hypothetical protein
MAQHVPSILLNWDMETMDFSEVKSVLFKKKFSDDDFGGDDF